MLSVVKGWNVGRITLCVGIMLSTCLFDKLDTKQRSIEFIGTWEELHNPDFKVVEFDHFKNEAWVHYVVHYVVHDKRII